MAYSGPQTGRCPHDQALSDAYVALRWALRDVLGQAGIPSNPGWGDEEIVEALVGLIRKRAHMLAVRFRYAECLRDAERWGQR